MGCTLPGKVYEPKEYKEKDWTEVGEDKVRPPISSWYGKGEGENKQKSYNREGRGNERSNQLPNGRRRRSEPAPPGDDLLQQVLQQQEQELESLRSRIAAGSQNFSTSLAGGSPAAAPPPSSPARAASPSTRARDRHEVEVTNAEEQSMVENCVLDYLSLLPHAGGCLQVTITRILSVYNATHEARFASRCSQLQNPNEGGIHKKCFGPSSVVESFAQIGPWLPPPSNCGPYGAGIYFPDRFPIGGSEACTFDVLVCDVALGNAWEYNGSPRLFDLNQVENRGYDSVYAPNLEIPSHIIYCPYQAKVSYKVTCTLFFSTSPPMSIRPTSTHTLLSTPTTVLTRPSTPLPSATTVQLPPPFESATSNNHNTLGDSSSSNNTTPLSSSVMPSANQNGNLLETSSNHNSLPALDQSVLSSAEPAHPTSSPNTGASQRQQQRSPNRPPVSPHSHSHSPSHNGPTTTTTTTTADDYRQGATTTTAQSNNSEGGGQQSGSRVNTSTSHNGVLDGFVEEATCPICADLLLESVTLDCSHTFCGDCLTVWVTTQQATCPVCRNRVRSKKAVRNRGMDNIVEKIIDRQPDCEEVREQRKQRLQQIREKEEMHRVMEARHEQQLQHTADLQAQMASAQLQRDFAHEQQRAMQQYEQMRAYASTPTPVQQAQYQAGQAGRNNMSGSPSLDNATTIRASSSNSNHALDVMLLDDHLRALEMSLMIPPTTSSSVTATSVAYHPSRSATASPVPSMRVNTPNQQAPGNNHIAINHHTTMHNINIPNTTRTNDSLAILTRNGTNENDNISSNITIPMPSQSPYGINIQHTMLEGLPNYNTNSTTIYHNLNGASHSVGIVNNVGQPQYSSNTTHNHPRVWSDQQGVSGRHGNSANPLPTVSAMINGGTGRDGSMGRHSPWNPTHNRPQHAPPTQPYPNPYAQYNPNRANRTRPAYHMGVMGNNPLRVPSPNNRRPNDHVAGPIMMNRAPPPDPDPDDRYVHA